MKFNKYHQNLSESSKNMFKLPDYFQGTLNLYSLSNFTSLYMPVLNSLNCKKICEIGAEKFGNTKILVEYCLNNDIPLDIVDPTVNFEISNELINFYKIKSSTYFNNAKYSSAYFMDGEHSFETVLNDLQYIHSIHYNNIIPFCIFIHDTSWPCAYRDLYYKGSKHYSESKSALGTSPWEESLTVNGWGAESQCFSQKETDHQTNNGVLSAIESFNELHPQYKFLSIPSIYGLTLIFNPSLLSDKQKTIFKFFEDSLNYFSEFLRILEYNRINLLMSLYDSGNVWEENIKWIKTLENNINKKV
jgi:hypothetical protein